MSLPNPTPPTLPQLRFSNANTTTERYFFGAVPELPHTPADDARVVEATDRSSVVLLVATGARAAGRADELHPAASNPTRASTVRHRRNDATPASSALRVMSQACPANALRLRQPACRP